jgi:hypothetical protein
LSRRSLWCSFWFLRIRHLSPKFPTHRTVTHPPPPPNFSHSQKYNCDPRADVLTALKRPRTNHRKWWK